MNCNISNISKNNIYTQCIWNANGELSCKTMNIETNKNNNYKNYNQFDNFSTPNNMYQPNKYQKNKQWYYNNTQNDCSCILKKKYL